MPIGYCFTRASCQAGVRLSHFDKIECHRVGLTRGLPGGATRPRDTKGFPAAGEPQGLCQGARTWQRSRPQDRPQEPELSPCTPTNAGQFLPDKETQIRDYYPRPDMYEKRDI